MRKVLGLLMMLPLLALICWSFAHTIEVDHEFLEDVIDNIAMFVSVGTLVIGGLLVVVGLLKLFDKGFSMACKRIKKGK